MQGGFAQIPKPGAKKPAGVALSLGHAHSAQRSSVAGQADKQQSARQPALLMSQPQVSAATGSVLQNLNSLLTDSAQSQRSNKELESKTAELQQQLGEHEQRIEGLEHDRVQLEGKLKYAESMSEEMRTEIITFRKNYDELKANVDKTKNKLNTAQELTRKAEILLEQSLPARLKDFEQRLNSVKDKHVGIKARYEEQEKALKEEVANKVGEITKIAEAHRKELAAVQEKHDIKDKDFEACSKKLSAQENEGARLKEDIISCKEHARKLQEQATQKEKEMRESLQKKEDEFKLKSTAMKNEIAESQSECEKIKKEYQDLTKDVRERTKALEAEQAKRKKLEEALGQERIEAESANTRIAMDINLSEPVAWHLETFLAEMEDKHKLALKCKEAVEQQHRLSLAQEFHRGKTAGEQDERARNAIVQKQSGEQQNAYLLRLHNERLEAQQAQEMAFQKQLGILNEQLKSAVAKSERLEQSHTDMEQKHKDSQAKYNASAEELRLLKEQIENIGQAALKEKKDLEAQRTAVEQKYEKQSESVEKLSGQIKSFKKDNEEYKKKIKQMEQELKKFEKAAQKAVGEDAKKQEAEQKKLEAAQTAAAEEEEREKKEQERRMQQQKAAAEKAEREKKEQEKKEQQKRQKQKSLKEKEDAKEKKRLFQLEHAKAQEKSAEEAAKKVKGNKHAEDSQRKKASTGPRHYGKIGSSSVTVSTFEKQASQNSQPQDAKKRKRVEAPEDSVGTSVKKRNPSPLSQSSDKSADKLFGDMW